jgi:hypothetical protein
VGSIFRTENVGNLLGDWTVAFAAKPPAGRAVRALWCCQGPSRRGFFRKSLPATPASAGKSPYGVWGAMGTINGKETVTE